VFAPLVATTVTTAVFTLGRAIRPRRARRVGATGKKKSLRKYLAHFLGIAAIAGVDTSTHKANSNSQKKGSCAMSAKREQIELFPSQFRKQTTKGQSLKRGEEARDVGMARAALAHLEELMQARVIAKEIAAKSPDHTCDADQVQKICKERGINLGPAAGSIFREKCWVWTGHFAKSGRLQNHSRLLRVWRLKSS
jgi:hypothetical protein